jgi:peptide/nickel transport system permease protein
MLAYIAGRLVAAIPVLFALSLVVFALLHVGPGDPAVLLLGQNVEPEAFALERADLGLDQPLPVQYGRWLANLLRGDLGRSIRTHQPVGETIVARLPVTVELGVWSIVVALAIGLPIGIFAAQHRNSVLDSVSSSVATVGIALPNFVLGLLLILLLSLWLGVLPPSGYTPFLVDPVQNLKLMAMPALTLGAALAASIARMMRSSLLDVLGSEFIVTARAKGVDQRGIITAHAIRNALLPVVTIIGLQLGALFGGAVLTETVFALPGVGRLIVDSIFARDFPVVLGAVLLLGGLRIVCNLGADIVQARLDPRIVTAS